MKKALITVIAFLLLFSFCACSAGEFISASKLEKIKEKSGIDANPVATLTLRYTDINEESSGEVYTVVIEYELLIDKAPITVINFMNLIQQGFYDNTVVDYIGERYLIAGRYSEEDDKFITKESGYTIKGEFLANGFKVDESKKDGGQRAAYAGQSDYVPQCADFHEKLFRHRKQRVFHGFYQRVFNGDGGTHVQGQLRCFRIRQEQPHDGFRKRRFLSRRRDRQLQFDGFGFQIR